MDRTREMSEHVSAGRSGRPSSEDGMLRAAFREVHGQRLHGFALLVTLGDERTAGALAAAALADGARRADTLRHPERGAAWLRAHVLRNLPRSARRREPVPAPQGRAVLAHLGVDDAGFAALRELGPSERAALVAGWIEKLDPRDLETVLGVGSAAVLRRMRSSRQRYLEAYLRRAPESTSVAADGDATGPLASRIRAMGERTFAVPRRPE